MDPTLKAQRKNLCKIQMIPVSEAPITRDAAKLLKSQKLKEKKMADIKRLIKKPAPKPKAKRLTKSEAEAAKKAAEQKKAEERARLQKTLEERAKVGNASKKSD